MWELMPGLVQQMDMKDLVRFGPQSVRNNSTLGERQL